jgi:hypothetical protein
MQITIKAYLYSCRLRALNVYNVAPIRIKKTIVVLFYFSSDKTSFSSPLILEQK